MTTDKIFSFEIQRFADYNLGADSGNVTVGGGSYASDSASSTVSSQAVYTLVTTSGVGASSTSIPSNSWISAGTSSVALTLDSDNNAITITGNTNGKTIFRLNALENNLRLNSIHGAAANFDLGSGSTFNQELNGAQFNFSADNGAVSGIFAADSPYITLNAGKTASIGSIDSNQVWNLTNGAAVKQGGLSYTAATAAGKAISLTGGSNNTLAFTLAKAGDNLAIGGSSEEESVTGAITFDGIGVNAVGLAGISKASKGYELTGGATAGTATSINGGDGGSAYLGASAKVTVTGTGSDAYISAISVLNTSEDANTWALGSKASVASLGSQVWEFDATNATLTAGTGGSVASFASFSGNATLTGTNMTQTIKINDGADWSVGGASAVAFDASGNISNFTGTNVSLSGEDSVTATFATKAGDSLTFAAGASASINSNNNISAVYGPLAANSDWVVKGKTNTTETTVSFNSSDAGKLELTFNKGTDKTFAVLTADSAGSAISSISGLTGNAVVNYKDAQFEDYFKMDVMGNAWSIAGAKDSSVTFDNSGNLNIAAAGDNTVDVTGAEGAVVTLTGSAVKGASINGAVVGYANEDSLGLTFGLEAVGTNAGIASISGVAANSNISVTGDTAFAVSNGKGTWDVAVNTVVSGDAEGFNFKLDGTGQKASMIVSDVENGEEYSVSGGNATFLVNGTDVSSAATADESLNGSSMSDSTNFAINGVNVTLKSSNAKATSITSADGDAIKAVTLQAGDAIYTDGDDELTVYFDKAGVNNKDSIYVYTVNDIQVSVNSSVVGSAKEGTTFNVKGKDVTITGALASVVSTGNAAEYTVTSGVYNIGKNTGATISEEYGFINIADTTKVTIQDASVKEAEEAQKAALESLATDASENSSLNAYSFFLDATTRGKAASELKDSTVVGFAGSDDEEPQDKVVSNGINIYGNDTLGNANLTAITLKANTTDAPALNIAANEGNSIKSAVVDLSSSNTVHTVLVGQSDEVAANHSIIGGSQTDSIIFGAQATGYNLAQGGAGDDYILNQGKQATLEGGAGNDTIIAGEKKDIVIGGAGADYFSDKNAVAISDYSFADGDVIIGSKLSSNGLSNLEQLKIDDNVITINGGGAVTLGSNYDGESALSVIIAGTDGSTANAKYIAWGAYNGSTIDVSESSNGVIVLGDRNDIGADLITGSAKQDTITAGANDTVYAGAGADLISLTAVEDSENLAAVVQFAEGKNSVAGWTEGFDFEEGGANVLMREAGAVGLTYKYSGNQLTVSESGSSMTFTDTTLGEDGTIDLLIGDPASDDSLAKVKYITSSAVVDSDKELADVYIASKKGSLTFGAGVESTLDVNLSDSTTYQNITALNVGNENAATVYGSATKDYVTVSGSAEAGANKTVSLGGGNDILYSGGTATSVAGNTIYFGVGDGIDTVNSFGFYQGSEADAEIEGADTLVLNTDVATWVANGSMSLLKNTTKGVEFGVSSSEKVILAGGTKDDIIRVKFSDSDVMNVKIGSTSGTNNFAYDTDTQLYIGNTNRNNDTITASGDMGQVAIWLTNYSQYGAGLSDPKGNFYYGMKAVDASTVTDSNVTIAGADGVNNVLYAGGSGSGSTLWGGSNSKNTLVGGAGEDTFIFGQGLGSNDTIEGATSADLIWLNNVTVNDLDLTKMTAANNFGIGSSSIVVSMKDGSSLTVNAPASVTTFQLADGKYEANFSSKTWGVAES